MVLPLILVGKILWISVFKQNHAEESPTLALVEEGKCILCRQNSTWKGLVVKEETGCLKNHCYSDRVERVQRVERGGWNGTWGAYCAKKAVPRTSVSGPERRWRGLKDWAERALAHGLEFTFRFLRHPNTPFSCGSESLGRPPCYFFKWGSFSVEKHTGFQSKTAEDPAIHFLSLGLCFPLCKMEIIALCLSLPQSSSTEVP